MQGCRPEESQAQAKNVKGQDPLSPQGEESKNRSRLSRITGLYSCWEKSAFKTQDYAMNRTKNDERPICAMPKASQDHCLQKIHGRFPFPAGTATQGNVQVIAEPATQTNVPASPKVLQPPGQKRLPEVDHEMKAQQLCAATCDIAVAAKVSIYLPSKRIRSDQNNPKIRCSELPAKSRICQQSAIVCDHALAHQPGKNQHQPIEKSVRVKTAIRLYLREKVPRPLNWARNQVRKQADE